MSTITAMPRDPYPFADTDAARMLRSRLDWHKANGVSLRTLAKKMDYTPAVLSHMASGRVGIPLEKAIKIADTIGLDHRTFLAAAVDQRARGAFQLFLARDEGTFHLAAEVKAIAGRNLDELSEEQKSVIREVALDPAPKRRWLAAAELLTVTKLREAIPNFATEGLPRSKLDWLIACLDFEP